VLDPIIGGGSKFLEYGYMLSNVFKFQSKGLRYNRKNGAALLQQWPINNNESPFTLDSSTILECSYNHEAKRENCNPESETINWLETEMPGPSPANQSERQIYGVGYVLTALFCFLFSVCLFGYTRFLLMPIGLVGMVVSFCLLVHGFALMGI
jgi:hypothetical protein